MAIGISRLSDVYLGHKHMNSILKKVYLKANSLHTPQKYFNFKDGLSFWKLVTAKSTIEEPKYDYELLTSVYVCASDRTISQF